MTKYSKKLINMVKAVGREIEARAEELVGDSDFISDFTIWVRFPQDGFPEIEADKTVLSKEVLKLAAAGKLTEGAEDD